MIYLDAQASTPIHPEVLATWVSVARDYPSNPHSSHLCGQKAMHEVDKSRDMISSYFGVKPEEIIFTSGATEANNLIIQGIIREALKKREVVSVITNTIEHSSVLEPLRYLSQEFGERVRVIYVSVGESGIVNPKDIQQALCSDTVLVSLMHANNEIGTIQPLREVSKLIQQFRTDDNQIEPYLHVDGAQAPWCIQENLTYLGVDAYTFSGHKIYAPKGIGGCFIKSGTPLQALMYGGGQEYNLRPGTVSPPLIASMRKAFELIKTSQHQEDLERTQGLRDRLWYALQDIPNISLNGSWESRLPHNLNISIAGKSAEALLIAFDMEGICLSTGSACQSGALQPSHVISAIKGDKAASCSLRISLSQFTTESEINTVITTAAHILTS